MARSTPSTRDLYENRPLYEDRTPQAADTALSIHSDNEYLSDDTDLDFSAAALAGLLGQYRKDHVFEPDPQTRRELRIRISEIEAELELRKLKDQDEAVKAALSEEKSRKYAETRLNADAAWNRLTRRAA